MINNNKLEQLHLLRDWLHSKYNIDLETFDSKLKLHRGITLKQMLADWESDPYLPLINCVITAGIEEDIIK